MNTVFSETQRNAILNTTVDNSGKWGSDTENPYACENTEDKIYLLSYGEANESGYFSDNAARVAIATDYAIAKGAPAKNSEGFVGSWWLREPASWGEAVNYIGVNGSSFGEYEANFGTISEFYGIRPALWLNLGE